MTSSLTARPARQRVVAASGALLLVGALSACGGGDTGSSASTADSAGSAGDRSSAVDSAGGVAAPSARADSLSGGAGYAAGEGGSADAGKGAAPQASTAARVLPRDRDVVYTGSISVRVTDIRRATDRV